MLHKLRLIMRVTWKWLKSVGRYQRGVAIVARETSLKRFAWWKRISLGFVMMPVAIVLFSDLPGGSETEYGVKAATSALGAAACLFIGLLPNRGITSPIDYIFQCTGVGFTIMAGSFWLYDATNGEPWPYIIAVAPIALGATGAIFMTTLAQEAGRWEDIYLKAREELRSRDQDDAGDERSKDDR